MSSSSLRIPWESRHARTNNALGLEVLAGHLEEDDGFIVLQGTLQHKGGECLQVGGTRLAKFQVGENFLQVISARLWASAILLERLRRNPKLPRHILDNGP